MLVKLGDNNTNVRYVQEWLRYHKFDVVIDGDFGNATETALKKFQKRTALHINGIVDDVTWEKLNAPLTFLDTLPTTGYSNLAEAIVLNAKRHYKVKPIEIGGQNMGPFVRYYMRGKEGTAYAWCAGSMSTIILQAFKMMKLDPINKFKYSFSCDEIYKDAKKFGTLINVPEPGCIFLSYKSNNPTDCEHTGIVTSFDKKNNVIGSFEGNTNDNGSREGFEFVPRIRSLTNKYFVKVA